MIMDLATLQENIGVRFDDENLLLEAVTHSSCLNESMGYIKHSLALAWLGDALIRWVVSEEVYRGELSTKVLHDLRERYIGEKYLAELAKDFSLDEASILPKGQKKMGGKSNLGNLHTVFEAVVGLYTGIKDMR